MARPRSQRDWVLLGGLLLVPGLVMFGFVAGVLRPEPDAPMLLIAIVGTTFLGASLMCLSRGLAPTRAHGVHSVILPICLVVFGLAAHYVVILGAGPPRSPLGIGSLVLMDVLAVATVVHRLRVRKRPVIDGPDSPRGRRGERR